MCPISLILGRQHRPVMLGLIVLAEGTESPRRENRGEVRGHCFPMTPLCTPLPTPLG